MSQPDAIELILFELRALAEASEGIREHLEAIDARLAAMPTSDEVDELRAIVTELQTDVRKLKDFVEGDPPLQDRLIALEENVAAFKIATSEREADIAEEAGTAGDPQHEAATKGTVHDLTDPQFAHASDQRAAIRVEAAESEARSELNVGGLRDRLNELVPAVKEMQGTTLLIMTIGALLGAVVLLVAIRALGF